MVEQERILIIIKLVLKFSSGSMIIWHECDGPGQFFFFVFCRHDTGHWYIYYAALRSEEEEPVLYRGTRTLRKTRVGEKDMIIILLLQRYSYV